MRDEAVAKPDAAGTVRDPIPVPHALRGAHRFVRATRDAATGLRAAADGRIAIGPRAGVIHVVLAREHLHRALLLVQAIITEAERRGWTIEPFDKPGHEQRAGVAIVIRAHAYPIEVHELTEALEFSEQEIAAWRRRPEWQTGGRPKPPARGKRKRATGRLRIGLPPGYRRGRVTWSESRVGSLSVRLPQIIETLEQRAADDDRHDAELALRREEWEREQRHREARARQARIEQARATRLDAELAAWERAKNIRTYVESLRERMPQQAVEDRERIIAWCDWAISWAERSDPVSSPELVVGLDDERDQHHYPRH